MNVRHNLTLIGSDKSFLFLTIGVIRMVHSKKVLREKMLSRLKNLSKSKREEINTDLHKQLFIQSDWQQAKTIGITISLNHEWDTWPIIEKAWQEKKKVVVPKCNPIDRSMTFHQISSKDDLEVQYYHLMEPIESKSKKVSADQIDLLIVPGVVFDHNHYRIGHGGGYYDRYLSKVDLQTISLVWHGQLVDKIEINQYDQPVSKLIVSTVN